MKVVAIVGSESHTSSSASARLEFADLAGTGKWERTPKAWSKKYEPFNGNNNHQNWFTLELDIPAGTRIRYSCNGRSGNRGVDKHEYQAEFYVREDAEVLEIEPSIGIATGLLKGRLVERVVAKKPVGVDTEGGF